MLVAYAAICAAYSRTESRPVVATSLQFDDPPLPSAFEQQVRLPLHPAGRRVADQRDLMKVLPRALARDGFTPRMHVHALYSSPARTFCSVLSTSSIPMDFMASSYDFICSAYAPELSDVNPMSVL